jgi:hypothetical protein
MQLLVSDRNQSISLVIFLENNIVRVLVNFFDALVLSPERAYSFKYLFPFPLKFLFEFVLLALKLAG